MALRRGDGFVRYALAIQYHGSTFLGFSYQGPHGEDCIVPGSRADLQGYRTVEGRLREALSALVGAQNYENIQVSSRTDRGVHAIKNTCHVDIRPRNSESRWDPKNIVKGLNFHLVHQGYSSSSSPDEDETPNMDRRRRPSVSNGLLRGMHEMRVLAAAPAPSKMKNEFYTGTAGDDDDDQPAFVDWNARFSATQRTYIYRLLQSHRDDNFGLPFEWDRSWRIRDFRPLDVESMRRAGSCLIGRFDFSSFRGSNCQRLSPVVTLKHVNVHAQPYGPCPSSDMPTGGLLGLGTSPRGGAKLVTVTIVGDSFVYRQVRNIVGCLVEVGRGKLSPEEVRQILAECDRSKAPAMAPAHGLFLADVQHGDFVI